MIAIMFMVVKTSLQVMFNDKKILLTLRMCNVDNFPIDKVHHINAKKRTISETELAIDLFLD